MEDLVADVRHRRQALLRGRDHARRSVPAALGRPHRRARRAGHQRALGRVARRGAPGDGAADGRVRARGRYAVGSGNSVPSYVPPANYLAMVEEAVGRRGLVEARGLSPRSGPGQQGRYGAQTLRVAGPRAGAVHHRHADEDEHQRDRRGAGDRPPPRRVGREAEHPQAPPEQPPRRGSWGAAASFHSPSSINRFVRLRPREEPLQLEVGGGLDADGEDGDGERRRSRRRPAPRPALPAPATAAGSRGTRARSASGGSRGSSRASTRPRAAGTRRTASPRARAPATVRGSSRSGVWPRRASRTRTTAWRGQMPVAPGAEHPEEGDRHGRDAPVRIVDAGVVEADAEGEHHDRGQEVGGPGGDQPGAGRARGAGLPRPRSRQPPRPRGTRGAGR